MKAFASSRVLLALIAVTSVPCFAAGNTATGTLNVQASIVDSCTVTGATLNFGNYDPRSGAAQNAQQNITVRCTNTTPYDVTMDAGQGSGATLSTRVMHSGGSSVLNYALYTESTRTTLWGDGAGGTGLVSDTGSGVDQVIPVYGKILANQNTAAVANYTDAVTISVAY